MSAFWVVFSILLGGGLFGFVGMIMGVPTFAVIYYLFQMFIKFRSWRKSICRDSAVYDDMSYVDAESGAFIHVNKEQRQILEEHYYRKVRAAQRRKEEEK